MNTKEAIERIKTRFDKWALDDGDIKAIQALIPELRESEDERIRKLLVWQVYRNIEDETNDLAQSVYDGIKGHDPDLEESIEDWKKCLAWLEKQKEEKGQCEGRKIVEDSAKCGPGVTVSGDEWANEMTSEDEKIVSKVKSILERAYKYGDASIDGCDFNEIYAWLEKQKEQKPVKLNDDTEVGLDRALQIVKHAKGNLCCYQSDDGIYECDHAIQTLEHILKNGIGQKSAEWSEEDKKMLESIIKRYEFNIKSDIAVFITDEKLSDMKGELKWLKALTPTKACFNETTPDWKPTKELMIALSDIMEEEKSYKTWRFSHLESLYNYLKTLQ